MTPKTISARARRRARYTGETYAQARDAVLRLTAAGATALPEAHNAAQQRLESRIMSAILSRPAPAGLLPVRAVRPFGDGIELLITEGLTEPFCGDVFAPLDGFTARPRGHAIEVSDAASSARVLLRNLSLRRYRTAVAAGSDEPASVDPARQGEVSAMLRRLALLDEPDVAGWASDWFRWVARLSAEPARQPGEQLVAMLADPLFGCAVSGVDGLENVRRRRLAPFRAPAPRRRRVFALMVGIDRYLGPMPALRGCRNDIEAAISHLRGIIPDDLHVVALYDEQATRAAVLAGFHDHLGQAGQGDSVLFWFSGSGSQAQSPLDPGPVQTLVCSDSRVDDVPDLYAPELTRLVDDIAGRGAHVVTVLDACHSGGLSARPSIVRSPEELAPDLPLGSLPGLLREDGRTAVRPEHVALAACRADETAQEMVIDGATRGLFSSALLSALTRLGPGATYRELMIAARAQVEDRIEHQVPTMSPVDGRLIDQPFLGGPVRRPATRAVMRRVREQWEIDLGACHGFAADGDGPTLVAVAGSGPLRQAQVLEVQVAKSLVAPVGWEPDPGAQYPVALAAVPRPAVSLAFDNTAGAAAAGLRAAIETAGPGGRPSPYLRVVETGPPDVIVSEADGLTALDGNTGKPLGILPDQDPVRELERLSQWLQLRRLDNPGSPLAGAVKIELISGGGGRLPVGADGTVELAYRFAGDGWQSPEVRISLRNTTDRRLYCILVDLAGEARSHVDLFPGGWVDPGKVAAAMRGRQIRVSLPQSRPVMPGATATDWLKLLVAEQPLDAEKYLLPRTGQGGRAGESRLSRPATAAPVSGSLVGHRDVAAAYRGDLGGGDWAVTTLRLITSVPVAV
ncbi:caspase family protein [Actinoplanes friuliensis]|uniref:Peptidase C14 caspase domain-containing protein n=1 Tax=Actinoplanes friuliensis DSM 7358 TaxID=1246995 RepID=U5VYF5_9ACTN|nr:caspase family protein [Actinoplanes friuliensis]AGZ41812.1 hypothetical protein AFR_17670 [Actinoplanes friuliensis DSM 7358]